MMYIKQVQNIFVQINISNEVKEKKKNATLMEKVFLAWPKKKSSQRQIKIRIPFISMSSFYDVFAFLFFFLFNFTLVFYIIIKPPFN